MVMKKFLWAVGIGALCLGTVPVGAGLVPVETLTVPGTGGVVTSDSLTLGQVYRFEASGTYFANDGIYADAEYSSRYGGPWQDLVQNYESLGPNLLDLQVNGGFVDWGPFNTDHIYNVLFTGTGAPATFNIYDSYPSNNSGSLSLSIYAVPAPAAAILGMLGLSVAGVKLRRFV